MVNVSAARSLLSWQSSRRVDLPGIDEGWFTRPIPEDDLDGEQVVDAGRLLIGTSADPAMMRLTGQVDQANLKALSSALEAVRVGGAPVIVDVSGLTFCSVAGMRQLSKAVADGQIQLMGIPAHMSRALGASALAANGAGS
jgi:anti-anti-sigma regulatory factor